MSRDRIRVLYVGGMGRSGSTVLADMIGEAAPAVSVGELRYLWNRGLADNQLCSCGVPFRDCAFWSEVMRQAFGGDYESWAVKAHYAGAGVDRMRHIPAIAAAPLRDADFTAAHKVWCDVITRLYRAIADVGGNSLIVDSSKDPSYAFALRSVPDLDVSVVHLVRDSRAVAYSWTRHKLRPEIHWQEQYMNRMSPTRSAKNWLRCNSLYEVFRARYGQAMRLRYEDFAAQPTAALDRVLGIVGVPRGEVSPTVHHSISGNPVRFTPGVKPVVVDNAWQKEMPHGVRRSVTALTSPLLAAYHYPLVVGES